MEGLILQTYRKLKGQLSQIEAGYHSPLQRFRLCLDTVIFEIGQLKQNIDPSQIQESQGQILFYKEMFPAYFSEVIYYRKLISVETAIAHLDELASNQLILQQLEQINVYLDRHRFLHRYVAYDKRYLDDILFIQSSSAVPVYPDSTEYKGSDFFNFNSFTISKIRAYGRAYVYLLRRSAPRSVTGYSMQPGNCGSMFVNNADFRSEKLDIDKKLAWLEKTVDRHSNELHLPKLEQRLRRRKAFGQMADTLLKVIQEQKNK